MSNGMDNIDAANIRNMSFPLYEPTEGLSADMGIALYNFKRAFEASSYFHNKRQITGTRSISRYSKHSIYGRGL